MKHSSITALVTAAFLAASGTATGATHDTGDQSGGKNQPAHTVQTHATKSAAADVYTWADGPQVSIPPGQTRDSQATCPFGQVPTGGGYNAFDGGNINLMVRTNSPTSDGWRAVARNTSPTATIVFWSVALCAPGTQVQTPPPAQHTR